MSDLLEICLSREPLCIDNAHGDLAWVYSKQKVLFDCRVWQWVGGQEVLVDVWWAWDSFDEKIEYFGSE